MRMPLPERVVTQRVAGGEPIRSWPEGVGFLLSSPAPARCRFRLLLQQGLQRRLFSVRVLATTRADIRTALWGRFSAFPGESPGNSTGSPTRPLDNCSNTVE